MVKLRHGDKLTFLFGLFTLSCFAFIFIEYFHVSELSNLVSYSRVLERGQLDSSMILTNQSGEITPCMIDRQDMKHLETISSLMRVTDVNCANIFSGDDKVIQEALQLSKGMSGQLDSRFYFDATQSCQHFQMSRGYVMSPLTSEEERFPLAYSLIIYTDLEIAERLLRAIYRPQNFYCIHVDAKVPKHYYKAIKSIVGCFPNVFIASKRFNVVWAKFSVLQADLLCMQELWKFSEWKYFINLAGQEFPLRTNLELVRILKAFRGANSVGGRIKQSDERRWKNAPPPAGIRPVKGSVHIVVNRNFVDYILHNRTALEILKWTKLTQVPDETFFPTLNFNPSLNIPGSYSGSPNDIKKFINRYKIWYDQSQCSGQFRRGICMLTTGDLPRLGAANSLFANKFLIKEDRLVVACLEEKLANTTRDEYSCAKTFDASYYSQLEFVKNRIKN